jgi:hypothetical protein
MQLVSFLYVGAQHLAKHDGMDKIILLELDLEEAMDLCNRMRL